MQSEPDTNPYASEANVDDQTQDTPMWNRVHYALFVLALMDMLRMVFAAFSIADADTRDKVFFLRGEILAGILGGTGAVVSLLAAAYIGKQQKYGLWLIGLAIILFFATWLVGYLPV